MKMNPTSRKGPHDGPGPSCYGGTSMHLTVPSPGAPCHLLCVFWVFYSKWLRGSNPPDEGRKEASSRSARWPLAGAEP